MESTIVDKFMRLMAPLSTEMKLEMLSKLSESLRAEFHVRKDDKSKLLKNLTGSWSDTADDLAREIINSRTFSEIKEI